MTATVVSGTQIDNYRIESVLGAGSMGDVYGGVDVGLGRKVAIKILSERHRDNDELRQRFVREGRAVAAIAHPNVVQVFATGQFDDRPYIAMEYLDGVDLGTAVEDRGLWPSLQAARAIRDAAQGLDAAAKAGLIHRDVKPSNLVLLKSGAVKVTDFGLAKPLNPGEDPQLTAMGVVVGTPDYIAPEQARGDAIDHRVDIYALGGTLYYLLAAVPPFRTGKPAEDKYLKVVARHLRQPAPDARDRNPAADPELAALARAMMSKKPDQRPEYAPLIEQLGEVVRRLERGGASPSRVVAASSRAGGQVSPTPFVGGRAPTLDDPPDAPDDDAAPTRVRIRAESARPAAGVAAAAAAAGAAQAVGMPAVPAPRVSRLLVAMTIASALVFLTGLGLKLLGPLPGRGAPGEQASGEQAPGALAPGEQAPAGAGPAHGTAGTSTPPAGMLLVPREDGSPRLFVDARPVTARAYAELFPHHKSPARGPDAPVTGVSRDYARSYALAQGKRLLTRAEWEAAARVEGFEAAGGLYEWVAGDGTGGGEDDGEVEVMSVAGEARRSLRGAADVTFRLARDP